MWVWTWTAVRLKVTSEGRDGRIGGRIFAILLTRGRASALIKQNVGHEVTVQIQTLVLSPKLVVAVQISHLHAVFYDHFVLQNSKDFFRLHL